MAGEVLRAAESAVRWAKRPSRRNPARTNYAQLLEDVCRAAKDGEGPIILAASSIDVRHWACLSRLLIMDEPALLERIHPRYLHELDCPQAVAMMQLWFQDVTGRSPAVRSWRHAREGVSYR